MSGGDGPVGKDNNADGTLIADDDEVGKTAKAMVKFDMIEQRFVVLQPMSTGGPLVV